MKKLLLVLITVLSVILVSTTFYSCEKEEENNNDLPSYPMSFNDDYLEYETIPHTKNCKATKLSWIFKGSPSSMILLYGLLFKCKSAAIAILCIKTPSNLN